MKRGKINLANKERCKAYYDKHKAIILAKQKAKKDADPDKYKAAQRAYYWKNKDAMRLRNKEYYKKNKAKQLSDNCLRKYGITIEQRDEILKKQGGICPICGTDNPGTRDWHIDHCHKTGRVRGVLCNTCNTGLGMFADAPEKLQSAVLYLVGGNNV